MSLQLSSKILKRIELSMTIKPLLIFSVTPFNFPIVPGSVRFDAFMYDSELCQGLFKQG